MSGTQKPKFILGKTFYVAAIGILATGLVELYEGARMGSSPESLLGKNAATAIEARSGKHWVRMFGLLADCSKAYDEEKNGQKVRTFYLATDVTKAQTFILNEPGACDPNEMHLYEGTLEKAPTYVTKLLEAAGAPAGLQGNALYLSVGEKASGTTQLGLLLGGIGVIGIVGTWWSRKQAGGWGTD